MNNYYYVHNTTCKNCRRYTLCSHRDTYINISERLKSLYDEIAPEEKVDFMEFSYPTCKFWDFAFDSIYGIPRRKNE